MENIFYIIIMIWLLPADTHTKHNDHHTLQMLITRDNKHVLFIENKQQIGEYRLSEKCPDLQKHILFNYTEKQCHIHNFSLNNKHTSRFEYNSPNIIITYCKREIWHIRNMHGTQLQIRLIRKIHMQIWKSGDQKYWWLGSNMGP